MALSRCWSDCELLGFDLETTGVDRFSDRPVAFALVKMHDGQVWQNESALINPGCPIPADASAVHGISTERAMADGVALSDAVTAIATSLVVASMRGVPVVGMNLDFDLTIIDVQCRAIDGRGLVERGWSGPVVDALVLDRRCDRYRKGRRTLGHLCAHYDVEQAKAHDALADAEAALHAVRAMCQRYPELHATLPEDLHSSQARWHRDWLVSFEHYLAKQNLDRLDPREYQWPIAAA